MLKDSCEDRASISSDSIAVALPGAVTTGTLAGFRFVASCRLPTRWGTFTVYAFADSAGREHVMLALGDVSTGEPVLVRVHSECLTGDALFSLRCDCGIQLRNAMQAIGEQKRGVILYLRQEGRGIGLHNKIRAYGLQDHGADTVDANVLLGFEADARDYSICAPMLKHVNVRQVRLLTNNPAKLEALRRFGFEVVERVALPVPMNPHNEAYLDTKVRRMGHLTEDAGHAQPGHGAATCDVGRRTGVPD